MVYKGILVMTDVQLSLTIPTYDLVWGDDTFSSYVSWFSKGIDFSFDKGIGYRLGR